MNICIRMNEALSALESALISAKRGISGLKPARPELLKRLACYEEVLRRQRLLASALEPALKAKKYGEIESHLSLIRTSSMLIQFDVKSLLVELKQANAS